MRPEISRYHVTNDEEEPPHKVDGITTVCPFKQGMPSFLHLFPEYELFLRQRKSTCNFCICFIKTL